MINVSVFVGETGGKGGGCMKRGGVREEFKNCQVQQKEQVEGVDQSIVSHFLFDST